MNERQQPEHLPAKNPILKLCSLYFEKAVQDYFASPDTLYIGVHSDETGPRAEYIALEFEGNAVHLIRPCPERSAEASFPYWLSEETVGIDRETNEPRPVIQTYALDHQGNFHQEIPQHNGAVLVNVNLHSQHRLLSILREGKVSPMARGTANEVA